MSEDNLNLEGSEIRYVFEGQEYVLGEENGNPELKELICEDGTRAIVVDGQYIVADNQAIVLQEGDNNLTPYYVNENNESFVIDGDESLGNVLFETADCVQLIEEDTSDIPQVICFTDESDLVELTSVKRAVEGIQDEEGNIYPFKRIRLEGHLLNFDEFVQQQAGLEGQEANEEVSMGYAILEDHSNNSDSYPQESTDSDGTEKSDQIIDLSKITGRNLITGQTVTLHSYMEKLKNRLNKTNTHSTRKTPKKIYNDSANATIKPTQKAQDEIRKPELSDLLDKKISIGKTKSGKKIIGKIIHVEKRNNEKPENNDPEEAEEEKNEEENEGELEKTDDPFKILVKKSTVSIESFEQISKTLGGVMEMESVRKKLENKNIVVKLVEKKYNTESDSFIKNTSYSYGYMEQEYSDGEVMEKWRFVPDQDTQDILLGEADKTVKKTKFPITTSLTILITHEKVGTKTIRVNLNPAPGNLCTICAQYFKTNLQLRHHMHQVHNTYGNNFVCEICDKTFDDQEKLTEHKNLHVQEGKLFPCPKCDKCFSTTGKLQKHLPTHDVYLRPLECSVCQVRCASEWALKKHLLTHTGIKPFSCDICSKQFMTQYDVNLHKKIHFPEKHFACNVCMRTFSRHSNLLRHTEIHKGTGALYKCDICYCSYNYISSLTRHMVQNHIEAAEYESMRKSVVKSE